MCPMAISGVSLGLVLGCRGYSLYNKSPEHIYLLKILLSQLSWLQTDYSAQCCDLPFMKRSIKFLFI